MFKAAVICGLTVVAIIALSCGENSGPLGVSQPTSSTLTATLQQPAGSQTASVKTFQDRDEYSAEVVWTQCPDDDFAWYALYRSRTPGIQSSPEDADTSIVFSSVSSTSWTDETIEDGETYYYALRTLNEYDSEAWSNEDSVVVPPDEPPAPSNLTGTYTGDQLNGQITLDWTMCTDDDFQSYRLYRSTQPGIQADSSSAVMLEEIDQIGNLNYMDNQVLGDTTYYYVLLTSDTGDNAAWSNEVSVSVPDLTPMLTVFFIDPSHSSHYSGDVILLKTPNLNYYLIDGGDRAGSWSCGVEKVLPILDSLGVDSLDGIVGTHPHSDHIGGLIGVLQSMPVSVTWDSGWPYGASATYEDFLNAIYAAGSDYVTPRRGDVLDWDQDLLVECIHPEEPLSNETNNASIVLRVTFQNVSFLFTGDLEEDGGEDEILAALSQGYIDDISADVLKVGHHGSYTSTSIQWLQAVDPDYAAIEVGYGNPYGHPHGEVVQRLENYGCAIYRTDQDGTFIMTTDGDNMEIAR
ncbi:MAG: MBL fold metallo-hydrolase [Candidatus Aegiribacteria sp.]|nr:MBL fold metallo-hydrolase [Candidatus Aegiribacteria sp.]MBD3295156.1 MBL fold metallo-hydrolase [Candidatus Fermentibacteria bacterium]